MEVINIKFKGRKYLLIGNLKIGGAIATKKQFENFFPSFAHLYANGEIKRYGDVIGKIEDLEIIK